MPKEEALVEEIEQAAALYDNVRNTYFEAWKKANKLAAIVAPKQYVPPKVEIFGKPHGGDIQYRGLTEIEFINSVYELDGLLHAKVEKALEEKPEKNKRYLKLKELREDKKRSLKDYVQYCELLGAFLDDLGISRIENKGYRLGRKASMMGGLAKA